MNHSLPPKRNRNSLRLQGFDYKTEGAYFITICCKNRMPFFGSMIEGSIQLSPIGKLLLEAWKETDRKWSQVVFDEFVVMPNHFHALLWFTQDGLVVPLQYNELPKTIGHQNEFRSPSGNLSSLVRGFKGSVTRSALKEGFTDFAWQKSFHDRIVRNDHEAESIRYYILNNPGNWMEDGLYRP